MPSKPLFSNCILCPISALLELSCAYKSPEDLSKNEDSGLVWDGAWQFTLLTSSQEMPVLWPAVHTLCSKDLGSMWGVAETETCAESTGAPQPASRNLPPPLTSYVTLGRLTYLFENPLSPVQKEEICPRVHVSCSEWVWSLACAHQRGHEMEKDTTRRLLSGVGFNVAGQKVPWEPRPCL